MGALTDSFTSTKVALDRSLQQIGTLLEGKGVRQHRYTHIRPETPTAASGPESIGQIGVELVWPSEPPVGVRVVVQYQPTRTYRYRGNGPLRRKQGTTAEMAARALYWHLKAKFDAIDYGLEEFEVAFLPYMITAGGFTFAERPQLVREALELADPDLKLLPPPKDDEA